MRRPCHRLNRQRLQNAHGGSRSQDTEREHGFVQRQGMRPRAFLIALSPRRETAQRWGIASLLILVAACAASAGKSLISPAANDYCRRFTPQPAPSCFKQEKPVAVFRGGYDPVIGFAGALLKYLWRSGNL